VDALDLSVFTWAAAQNPDAIPTEHRQTVQDAIESQQYSKMDKMKRVLTKGKQEEQFIIEAARIILNA